MEYIFLDSGSLADELQHANGVTASVNDKSWEQEMEESGSHSGGCYNVEHMGCQKSESL